MHAGRGGYRQSAGYDAGADTFARGRGQERPSAARLSDEGWLLAHPHQCARCRRRAISRCSRPMRTAVSTIIGASIRSRWRVRRCSSRRRATSSPAARRSPCRSRACWSRRGRAASCTKLIQMVRAVQLEERYSKDEILSLYLTLAPFGGNLEGVRAASLSYFGKEPGRIDLAEAALLVALPQSPVKQRPDRHAIAALEGPRQGAARAWSSEGIVTAADARIAMREGVPFARQAMPLSAPHLADATRAPQCRPAHRHHARCRAAGRGRAPRGAGARLFRRRRDARHRRGREQNPQRARLCRRHRLLGQGRADRSRRSARARRARRSSPSSTASPSTISSCIRCRA